MGFIGRLAASLAYRSHLGIFFLAQQSFIDWGRGCFSWVSCCHLENESKIVCKKELSLEVIWEIPKKFWLELFIRRMDTTSPSSPEIHPIAPQKFSLDPQGPSLAC